MYRIDPSFGAQHYKTYQILAPKSTHFRSATCSEVECQAHVRGWKSTIDTTTELGKSQYHYITEQSKRKYVENRLPSGLVEFEFEAGQTCFAASEHKVRLDKPEIFLVKDGDHRGNPRGTAPRKHQRASDWVEDFAEHQQSIADIREKGSY